MVRHQPYTLRTGVRFSAGPYCGILKQEYGKLANLYDVLYSSKDYLKETNFIIRILKKNKLRSVLDAGCGTGTHLHILEGNGFEVMGLDLNQEMLNIAEKKVSCRLLKANITDFKINKKFDSIISLFAVFNHLLNNKDSKKALYNFSLHLKKGGILILDLHNPQKNGKKVETRGSFYRKMKWTLSKEGTKEKTDIFYKIFGKKFKDSHEFRIYSINEIISLLKDTGFAIEGIYDGFSNVRASPKSKNLLVIARLK
jgi:SAM-dependent methyltransferase